MQPSFLFVTMEKSKYLKTYTLPEAKGRRLLFSYRRTSLCLLSEAECLALEQGQADEQTMSQLAALGMLVPDRKEELQEVKGFYAELNRINPNVTAAVVLGMECNFACRYCYEGTLKGRHVMDDATAEQTLIFIKERFRGGKDKIHLDFYGGEPLLYPQRLRHLAGDLKAFAEARGSTFDFNLVTNGSLLTRKLVEELKRYGLAGIKVTIDGPAANHNSFRPFKNGRPSFAAIVKNLQAVSGLVEITLGGNFTKDNYQQFPKLLDELQALGLGPQQISKVSFNMVMAIKDQFASPEFNGGCGSVNEPWFIEAALHVRGEVMARGYQVAALRPEVCAVMIDDNFSVHYDGSLYKCLPLGGREQFKIGDVWEGVKADDGSHHLDNWQEDKRCPDCDYLPLCYGGCRFMTYQRTGSMAGVDCQHDFFEQAIPSMLSQDLRYRYGLKG